MQAMQTKIYISSPVKNEELIKILEKLDTTPFWTNHETNRLLYLGYSTAMLALIPNLDLDLTMLVELGFALKADKWVIICCHTSKVQQCEQILQFADHIIIYNEELELIKQVNKLPLRLFTSKLLANLIL